MSRLWAAILILLLMPVILFIATIQLFAFGRIFFVQQRVGKDEKIFSLIKFQSMKMDGEGQQYISFWGKFLRRSSLDEIPQLFNILAGHMNFIGPRPLLPAYLPLYNEQQKGRHRVKPGLSGWAQVQGRNAISWQEQFTLDLWYIEHRSFKLDCMIIILSLVKIFKGSRGETKIREAFNGKN